MKRLLRIIISLSLLTLSIGGGVFFLWPGYQELSSIRQQIDEHRDRVEQGEQALARLENVRGQVEARRQDFEKIDVALPADPMVPALLDHIGQLASSSGLVLVSVSERLPLVAEGEPFQKILITLELQGSYEGLRNFLDAARRSSRILILETVSAETSQAVQQRNVLSIAVSLVAFAQVP